MTKNSVNNEEKTSGIGVLTASVFNCGSGASELSREGWNGYHEQYLEFKNQMIRVCADHGFAHVLNQPEPVTTCGNKGFYVTNEAGEKDIRVDISTSCGGPTGKTNGLIVVNGYVPVYGLVNPDQKALKNIFNETKITCAKLLEAIGQQYANFIGSYNGLEQEKVRTMIGGQDNNFANIEPDYKISGVTLGHKDLKWEQVVEEFSSGPPPENILVSTFSQLLDTNDIAQRKWGYMQDGQIEIRNVPVYGEGVWSYKRSEKSADFLGVTNKYPLAPTEEMFMYAIYI